MRTTACQPRENRTIAVDFQDETTYFQLLLNDGKAFVECVLAFLLLPRLSAEIPSDLSRRRVPDTPFPLCPCPLDRVTIWRIQCTSCKAVFTVLPHFVLCYRSMRPDVARNALLVTHGGLRSELCVVLCHISPMALYRLICTLGQHSLVTTLTPCGLLLLVCFLGACPRISVRDLQKNKIPYIVEPLTGTSSQVLSTDERFL